MLRADTPALTALLALAIFLFRDWLPVPARFGLFPAPLLLGVAYGLLTACAFAIWPLARAAQIPGAALFRDCFLPTRVHPKFPTTLAGLGFAAALVGLAIVTSPDRRFALWFCAASLASLVVFRVGAGKTGVLGRGHTVTSSRSRTCDPTTLRTLVPPRRSSGRCSP